MARNNNKVVAYKVWIHIEGLNADGDQVEGDDHFEPIEVGRFDTDDEAFQLRDHLMDVAGV